MPGGSCEPFCRQPATVLHHPTGGEWQIAVNQVNGAALEATAAHKFRSQITADVPEDG